MNNDLNQNINNNVTPQPMPNGTPVPPQPVPNPVEQPVQPQPMNTMNTGMAQPMSNPNPMPQEPMMNQAPAQPMGNPMPEQPMNPQQMNMQQPTMQQPTMAQPEPPKEKKKSNPVLIFLMFVALIGGAGYFGYNYFIANKDVNSNTNNSGTTETTNEETNYESIAKEKMPTVLSLAHQVEGEYVLYAYCGSREKSDLTKDTFLYSISKNYKTLTELQEYLNTIMTKELYDKYFLKDTEKYIEQDGNLYCAFAPTDGIVINYMSEDSINKLENLKYEISNQTETSFDAKLSFVYSSEIDQVENKEYTFKASFIKENDNWLIDSFE